VIGYAYRHPVEAMTQREALAESALEWVLRPAISCNHRTATLRLLAAVYCVCPHVLNGASMAQIARTQGVTKQAFQKTTAQFRDLIGLGYIRTDKEREAMKQAALKWHRARKSAQ